MAEIYIDGFVRGSDLGTVSATIGADSGNVAISAYRQPSALAGLPRLSDGFDTDNLTVDVTGLTNITAYDWREVGGATLSATSTLAGTGHGGKYVECEVTCDQGVLVSPPIRVYESTMMGMSMDPQHLIDDTYVVNLVPHTDITHLAVQGGNWTDSATWLDGRVPRNGARFLIPHGITLNYDQHKRYRLDWGRVDGVLNFVTNKSTDLLVETLVGTRGSELIMGTGANPIPEPYQCNITVSGQDYRTTNSEMSDINITRDPGLWGRGVISQGVWRIWGDEKLSWSDADPMDIGATGAWLHKVPTGWKVGSEIVIYGTSVTDPQTSFTPLEYQDETRTITAINGSVVSWAEPLIYPHKNQLAGSTRTDLYPKVMLKKGHNVTIQGEVTDTSMPWRRGHTACMHHWATVDHWFCNFVNLGRTDKSRPVGKTIGGGQFRVYDYTLATNAVVESAVTAQSNSSARYPVHMHHVGFEHMGARPIVHGCYVEGTPGWAMVHHACDVDFEECAIYDFFGAGMVSEQGNELGGWINNICGHATTIKSGNDLSFPAKLLESLTGGLEGDNFKYGYAYAYRGRAIRAVGNVANSAPWGHIFYHRGFPETEMFPILNHKRKHLDLGDIGLINSKSSIGRENSRPADYPINHFANNESVACLGGFNVSKGAPQQSHDVNIKLKNFRAWGCEFYGMALEYIGNYILINADVVGQGPTKGQGIDLAANVFQLAIVNSRIEGFGKGVVKSLAATDADLFTGEFDPVTEPRFFEVGVDLVNVGTERTYTEPPNQTPFLGTPPTWMRDDFDGTLLDYDLDPSDTYPLILGEWNGLIGGGATLTNRVTNADGRKISNHGSTMGIAPKVWSERVFEQNVGAMWPYAVEIAGHWDVDLGSGAETRVVLQDIISDPLTGRPHRFLKMYDVSIANPPGDDNGVFGYSATPVTQSNKLATVAIDGTVVIDPIAGATGGDGVNYKIAKGKYAINLKPDHGVAVIDYVNGTVSYTPDRGYVGTDEMHVFVESGGQSATVRIDILIGSVGAVSAPTVPTVTDHADANTIGVQLLAPPSAGGRRIDLVQYSTDAGATWRRLTHGWVQAVHKVTVESDGTAISAGSYDVRIRYKTNYDYTVSAATADAAVTVT